MRPKTRQKGQTEDLWERYLAIQLTSEQKAAAHKKAERKVEKARRDGVYARALEIVGTVEWSIPWQDLRMEER